MVAKAQQLIASLTARVTLLQRYINEAEAAVGNQLTIKLLLSVLGTFVLLLANMIGQ